MPMTGFSFFEGQALALVGKSLLKSLLLFLSTFYGPLLCIFKYKFDFFYEYALFRIWRENMQWTSFGSRSWTSKEE